MQTADRIQYVDWVQNVDCRLQSGYKMQTENLKSFFFFLKSWTDYERVISQSDSRIRRRRFEGSHGFQREQRGDQSSPK